MIAKELTTLCERVRRPDGSDAGITQQLANAGTEPRHRSSRKRSDRMIEELKSGVDRRRKRAGG